MMAWLCPGCCLVDLDSEQLQPLKYDDDCDTTGSQFRILCLHGRGSNAAFFRLQVLYAYANLATSK